MEKASPAQGWLLVSDSFAFARQDRVLAPNDRSVRVRVLLDLGLGGGETGMKLNYLRFDSKHTVNKASKAVVRGDFQNLCSCICQ